jgi:hypothetical protein
MAALQPLEKAVPVVEVPASWESNHMHFRPLFHLTTASAAVGDPCTRCAGQVHVHVYIRV